MFPLKNINLICIQLLIFCTLFAEFLFWSFDVHWFKLQMFPLKNINLICIQLLIFCTLFAEFLFWSFDVNIKLHKAIHLFQAQIKKFLKNIGIRTAPASGIRAAATTGRMMVRADSGVASILIPKTVQNGIRGLLHFSSPKVFIYKKIMAFLLSLLAS
jgi:hypothetical protein